MKYIKFILLAALVLCGQVMNAITLSEFFDLIKDNEVEEVKDALLQDQALINAQRRNPATPNKNGATPLYIAVWYGNKDMVRLLLDKGANANAHIDDKHCTVLHIAIIDNNKEIVQPLLDRAADVNARDNCNDTPLHYATFYNKRELVELLINKGAQVNAQNSDGKTPLHIAAQYDRREIAQVLLTRGANVNIQDKNSETPLHSAAQYGKLEMLQILLNFGCINFGITSNAQFFKGYTALDIAREYGWQKMVDLLKKKEQELPRKYFFLVMHAIKNHKLIMLEKLLSGNQQLAYAVRNEQGNNILYRALFPGAKNTESAEVLGQINIKENAALLEVILTQAPELAYDLLVKNNVNILQLALKQAGSSDEEIMLDQETKHLLKVIIKNAPYLMFPHLLKRKNNAEQSQEQLEIIPKKEAKFIAPIITNYKATLKSIMCEIELEKKHLQELEDSWRENNPMCSQG